MEIMTIPVGGALAFPLEDIRSSEQKSLMRAFNAFRRHLASKGEGFLQFC
jgi:hypothetical protein